MLARLEHGGALTTPLDEHGDWHRYHPLFAELLRAELRAQLPDEVAQLHRRAAAWLAAHGDDAAALRHAAAGGAWDLAAELTTTRWFAMMINGEMGALRPILETMPRELVEASPELALAFGGALLARGEHAGAQPYLRRADEGEALVPPDRRAPFAASRAAMALYEGRLRGDPEAALGPPASCSSAARVLESGDLAASMRSSSWASSGSSSCGPATSTRRSRISSGPTRAPLDGATTGPRSPPRRTSRWRAHSAADPRARAPRRRGAMRWRRAAAGAGRSRRVPPTACRRPWHPTGPTRGGRDLHGPRAERSTNARAPLRAATASIARCC